MNYDILCFCHLRWNFVYQRPQQLLSRFATEHRVFFVEEPVWGQEEDRIDITQDRESMVWIIVPHLLSGRTTEDTIAAQKMLLNSLLVSMNISQYLLWYYSPMALTWTDHLQPAIIVYDCMDELSAFKFAPPELIEYETQLFKIADLVFTGGNSLFEIKKEFHQNIFSFPSSIDKKHFAVARMNPPEPDDQRSIPHPRLGYYGVIDERIDIELIEEMASVKPDWHFILLGPFAKINPATLPQKDNIHYLGGKDYKELPLYLGGWDIAIMPFALNDSTRYISPTKTPEYLAGGKRVVSTAINDVVIPYGVKGLVQIAGSAAEFISAAEAQLTNNNYDKWLNKVDTYLSGISWDQTWQDMHSLINLSVAGKSIVHSKVTNYV